jgi:hypothetical protein
MPPSLLRDIVFAVSGEHIPSILQNLINQGVEPGLRNLVV